MRRRHALLLAALSAGAVAAIAACTLNPQPLPPRDEFGGESALADASTRDGGTFGTGPENPGVADAAVGTPSADADADGGADEAGDGGDSGDAADASDAADADGG